MRMTVEHAPFEIEVEIGKADRRAFERRLVLLHAFGDVHAGDEDGDDAVGRRP